MQNNEKLMKEFAIIPFLMMSFEESYTRNKKKYTKNLPIEDKIVPIYNSSKNYLNSLVLRHFQLKKHILVIFISIKHLDLFLIN